MQESSLHSLVYIHKSIDDYLYYILAFRTDANSRKKKDGVGVKYEFLYKQQNVFSIQKNARYTIHCTRDSKENDVEHGDFLCIIILACNS